jgi:hypothetical protein
MPELHLPGKKVRRTRWVRTDRFVIAVEVEATVLDADPTEAVFDPSVVALLREVRVHADQGDVEWLRRHGKVFVALDAA